MPERAGERTLIGRAARWSASLVLVAAVTPTSARAEAYRPFDGTDADVAELGSFELEMGPAHWYSLAGQNHVIAPATVLNFGVLKGTELEWAHEPSDRRDVPLRRGRVRA